MISPPSHLLSLPVLDVGSLTLFVLPLLVELAVLARGMYTREPTDIVLAAVAVPCLFVSMWAAVEGLNSSGGVDWSGLFGLLSAAVGGLLLFLVVIDAVMGFAVRARTTE
ncbi:hypothetical protein [Natrialba aegyptia]|uniref:Uncharacterized protein n=1 Tax=Natrialba aegyptia DSM 13077 TaxID=1227491 RepID=M0B8H1_9EURY|nr:hypothetical protein [Natrialba aegyptia]ELZ06568.1 hypothetical protein C480_09525 [Natrialba aegyptia DSM 13077]